MWPSCAKWATEEWREECQQTINEERGKAKSVKWQERWTGEFERLAGADFSLRDTLGCRMLRTGRNESFGDLALHQT